ncbi:MAG: hypothetical protein J5858_11900 [Lentisphaeria bacterium]|nr:hypothetical protein [Lentisphaeria bacterium]
MKITFSSCSVRKRHYVPPALGNGLLSLMIDREGNMAQNEYCGMTPVIVRAGCRYDHAARQLIRFGYFEQRLSGAGKLTDFRQTLDLECGCCRCTAHYESGLEVVTTVFCHLERNIIVVRKEFASGRAVREFSFRYTFPETPYLRITSRRNGRLNWQSGTRSGYVQVISSALRPHFLHNGTLEFSGRTMAADFFLSFDETLSAGEDFDTLFASHSAAWKKYWSDSRIEIPDKALQKMYMTAQYHLRISSTPWSVPTGIFPTHWEGRFFAYDEFYIHGALLTSGHFSEAEKIVRFRAATLPAALHRACFLKLCPEPNLAAHYPWETLEDGSEGGPEGFWLDRYIHMANIGLSCWEHWCFTRNRGLLEHELYPVIRACAEYFRRSAVYTDSLTGPYIGKCTDMERLGELVERPYSTTCGGIALFRAAACCAEILRRDAALRKEWKSLAEKLLKNLPADGKSYVPYPGCRMHSIAMYHGLFPYGVVSPDDPRQSSAIRETEDHFQEFAGQYFKGKKLSAWYAGVIASAEIRRGNAAKALALLSEAAKYATGCFYECFEVYEKQKLPWFSTASGTIVRALNELLLYASSHKIELWPGRDYTFDLPSENE